MELRDDIVRGLRMGGILLALFIVGVAAFRISRESPPPKAPVAREAPAPVATRVPDARYLNGPPIPPPPPVVGRKTRRRVEPAAVAPAAVAPMEVERRIIEPVTKEAPAEAAEQPEPAQEKNVDLPEPVEPVAPDTPVAKPASRPKRWLHAVGRFLHVVH